ncbi:MAG: hypothetical protein LBT97_06795, partial [Planctomycetota bacterium]|nr:hypothetical protein [Planctomycetota bacterium]
IYHEAEAAANFGSGSKITAHSWHPPWKNSDKNRAFANWACKPPNAQFVKITTLEAQAFPIFAKWRLAV